MTDKTDRLPQTLLQAVRFFADEDEAIQFVADMRWPEGEQACPKCGSIAEHYFMKTRKRWKCRFCRHQFSVKVGTIFEGSPIKLSKWLPAVWMLGNSKNGISSYELARALGVTQKTAWFMLHRIRETMSDDDFSIMDGEVEVDETYIGGKAKNMHIAKRKRVIKSTGGHDKTAVMGLLERPRGSEHSLVRALWSSMPSPKSGCRARSRRTSSPVPASTPTGIGAITGSPRSICTTWWTTLPSTCGAESTPTESRTFGAS